jgi:hypothetical protein
MNIFRINIIIVVMAALMAWAMPGALAEDISVEATVTANRINLGNSAQLVLTVHGTQKADPISLPAIDGFDTRYIGPQTQVSIVNGNYNSTKSFIYSLFPNKTGQFKIPSLSITVDDREFQTQPIDMTVEDAAAPASGASGAPGDLASSLKDKIMLIMGTSKNEAYIGEQVPLTVKLLYAGVTISEIQFPSFESVGFTKTDFAQPQQSQQVINGVGFNIVDFRTFVSPTRTGALTLGPAKIEANLVYRSAQNTTFGTGTFANDLFDNFFNTYEKRVLTATSQPLALNVLPLPEEGKPDDFSGAVGQFDFTVTASPSEVKVGDPITLRMKITGNGNLKAITFPSFNDQKFKTYDPQIKDEGNTKVLEQVIIPTSERIKEIPALHFSYFDTQEKKYKTIRQGPFTVSVKAPAPGEEFKAVGFEATSPKITVKEELGQDLVFIKERPGILRPMHYHVYKRVWFWLILSIYLVAWSGVLVWYFIRRRLKTDERFARRFKAPRQAREGIAQAEVFKVQGQVKEFYGAVIKTLKDYLGNQLHVPSGGMTSASIEPLLRSRQVDEKIIASIRSIFETADMVRFASIRPEDANMDKTFENLKVIIDDLERHL